MSTYQKKKAQQEFESQKQVEEMTQAEAEELAVRKRRAEGTPCTEENFLAWKEKFDAEMALLAEKENDPSSSGDGGGGPSKKKNKEKVVDKSGRITGFLQFSDKAGGTFNLEAMEAAAENAQADEDEAAADDEAAAAAAVEDEDLFDLDDDDLDGGQKKGHKNANDGNHDEQLYQGKAKSTKTHHQLSN